ncbi:MAG: hypothetical protein KAG18_01895, partial [Sinobacterium sp.]|nr:hypothetical protein [Sinobacterium sp.]
MMTRYLITLCLLAVSFSINAKDVDGRITTDIIEVSMNTGYYTFDDEWDLSSASFIGWGLGFQFNRAFRAVINYSRINPSKSELDGFVAGANDVKLQRYNADMSYSFFTEKSIRPYIALSYG